VVVVVKKSFFINVLNMLLASEKSSTLFEKAEQTKLGFLPENSATTESQRTHSKN